MVRLVSLAMLLAPAWFPRTLAAQEAPSIFTGDVKPVLYVKDVQAAARFYRDVLGFGFLGYTNIDGEPYYAEMTAGPLKFGLHEPQNAEQEEWVGHQRIYFRVTDLAVQRTAVAERGGKPGEVVRTAWMDYFIVRDPDRHEIVFAVSDPARHKDNPWRVGGSKGY
jgi:predicted enzyme related to lactoylglutathione lyase